MAARALHPRMAALPGLCMAAATTTFIVYQPCTFVNFFHKSMYFLNKSSDKKSSKNTCL